MPAYQDIRHSPYPTAQIFALVADVEKYPEFLPWCRAARIVERQTDSFIAELVICFKHITEHYTSRVVLFPHERIEVTMLKGPFHHLNNRWEFHAAEEGGTNIDFHVDFAFKSKLLDRLIGGLFARASQKMSAAFMARADALYGDGEPSA